VVRVGARPDGRLRQQADVAWVVAEFGERVRLVGEDRDGGGDVAGSGAQVQAVTDGGL
jgi:hypothetical protein